MATHCESVNIPELDQQHNELFCAVKALKESSEIIEDFGRIIAAVEAHFQAEEDLFDKYKIPNVITHRSEHTKFLALLRKTQAELKIKHEAKEDLSGELQQVVQSATKWLKIHTNAYDAPQYGTFFKNGEYIGR